MSCTPIHIHSVGYRGKQAALAIEFNSHPIAMDTIGTQGEDVRASCTSCVDYVWAISSIFTILFYYYLLLIFLYIIVYRKLKID